MHVKFSGAPEKYAPMIRERATAVLKEMEREFAGLKVEISNGKASSKLGTSEAKVPDAGKDSRVARIAGKGTAGRPQRRKAKTG